MANSKGNTQTSAPPIGHRPGAHMGLGERKKIKLKDTKGTLKRLLKYLSHWKLVLIAVFLFTVASTVVNVVGTRVNGTIIDKFIVTGDMKGLTRICLIMLGIYAASVIAIYFQSIMMVDVAQGTVTEIRRDLFNHMQKLPVRFYDTHDNGDLMSRLTNDVDNINVTLSQSVTQLFGGVINISGMFIAMILLNPLLTLVGLSTIPLMFLVTKTIAKHSRKFFKEQQRDLGSLNGFVEEIVSGQKIVKVFNREDKVKGEFSEINLRLRKSSILAQIFSGNMGPIMNFVNNLTNVIVGVFGGYLVISNRGLTPGLLFTFILYMRNFARPVNEIANLFNTVQSALAGAERVFEIMDEKGEPDDSAEARVMDSVLGEVAAEDVTFSYVPERPVLKKANFSAKPGQTIALVGPTGAGKTTVVSLLTRFYDVDSGSIKIDGIDIRDFERSSLRSSLAIVLQDTFLFSETIRENIRYGRLGATDEEVEQAARLANCHSFIIHLPQGYDTVLADNGGNLSQGQRQLISIARAILANPAILILDEATSSIDTRTELELQQAMLQLMKGRTSFVIAHRLSTIRNADQILVINQGEIVERGNHEELLRSEGFYANLYNSQFNTGLVEL
jgi:ATP-binding cassette, subfamily B, multidrug efflux pump